jgi:hypothetical protein
MKDIQGKLNYVVLPKTVVYHRAADKAKLRTKAIVIQVVAPKVMSAIKFRETMADKCERLDVRSGGALLGKQFIHFGKEANMGDQVMTIMIQAQNQYIQSDKHNILNNMNDIDEVFNIEFDESSQFDCQDITLREIIMSYKMSRGNGIIKYIEQTNSYGTYQLTFHNKDAADIDNMISDIDDTIVAIGDWDQRICVQLPRA